MRKRPLISIVIATYTKSPDVLKITLDSIARQKCPPGTYEIIISDNRGGKPVKDLADKHNAILINVSGKPPQACKQFNIGAKRAKGKYIFIMDHDLELSSNVFRDFIKDLKTKENRRVDAWMLRYKIVAKGKLLSVVRNFEEEFYLNSVIATPRIIKSTTFWKCPKPYDVSLMPGPADWDLAMQLREINATTKYLKGYVSHHEENMTFWQFLSKKSLYTGGTKKYIAKWKKRNPDLYMRFVKKQFDPIYRLFTIFIENAKWKKLINRIHLYFLFLFIKVVMAFLYRFRPTKTQKSNQYN